MSALEFKHDWDTTKARWTAWWNRELTDGPLLGISAPRKKPLPSESPPPISTPFSRWLDRDAILSRAESQFARNASLDGGFPSVAAGLGPGSMGVFLGAEPVFDHATVWYKPCFDDIRAANLSINRKSQWWQWTLDFTRRAVARAQGRYLVGIPDLIENLDTLAALLENEKLLYYLVDAPAEVHRLQEQLLPLWFEAFDELYELVKGPEGGHVFTPFMVWAPGKLAKLQCDFSAMISPDMFAEFVLPYLQKQCDRLDYSLYHLDGPSAVGHLDLLLSIDSLDCIQWTPGAGQPSAGDPTWDKIHRKVLDAGKLIWAGMTPAEVRPFVKRLGKKYAYLCANTKTEDDALRLIVETRSA